MSFGISCLYTVVRILNMGIVCYHMLSEYMPVVVAYLFAFFTLPQYCQCVLYAIHIK